MDCKIIYLSFLYSKQKVIFAIESTTSKLRGTCKLTLLCNIVSRDNIIIVNKQR